MVLVPPLLVLLAKSPFVDEIDISCVEEILVGAAPTSAQLEREVTSRLGAHVCIRQSNVIMFGVAYSMAYYVNNNLGIIVKSFIYSSTLIID